MPSFTEINSFPLPYEILLMVFEYLSLPSRAAVARVCKKWKSVAYDPILWAGVEPRLKFGNHSVYNAAVLADSFMLRKIVNINVAAFSGKKSLDLKYFLLSMSGSVESLNLAYCNLKYAVVNECFPQEFPNLIQLNLSYCWLDSRSFLRICKSVPNLKQLILADSANATNAFNLGIGIITETLNNLDDLEIAFTRISHEGCNQLKINGFVNRLKRLHADRNCTLPSSVLEMLDLTHLKHLSIDRSIALSPLVRLKSLVSLKLWNMSKDQSFDLIAALPSLVSLKALDISRSSRTYLHEVIRTIVESRSNLQALVMNSSSMTDESANLIACRMQQLKVLSVGQIQLDDPSFFLENVARFLQDLSSFCFLGHKLRLSEIHTKLLPLKKLDYLLIEGLKEPKGDYLKGLKVDPFVNRQEASGASFFRLPSSYF